MASILKRKRGPVEVIEALKRAKSKPEKSGAIPVLDESKSGWDAAFGSIKRDTKLATVNGTGNDYKDVKDDDGSGSEDYDKLTSKMQLRKQAENDLKRQADAIAKGPKWKTSAPIGGRMINIDPVFTQDEKYLIVAHRRSIRVYTNATSLLNRTIHLNIDISRPSNVQIVAFALSSTNTNTVWVACSDGAVYHIDWTSGEGADQFWTTSSMGIIHMTVASMSSAGRIRDVIFTTEERRDGGRRITAHELTPPGSSVATVARTIYTSTQPIHILKAAGSGSIIVAASEERVLLGALRSTDFDTVDKIRYEFRIFDSTDFISSMDVRVSERAEIVGGGGKKKKAVNNSMVDIVVGDVKGAIFVHNDLLAKLVKSQTAPSGPQAPVNLLPRKLHWHRKAVLSVKWSLDGNYIISGGSETVLSLWQLDTGKQQFLPHLSASIQNIVVSPTGSSYAIRIADNSTMVLSTSELTPTTNIAGIQANVIGTSASPDSHVLRVQDEGRKKPLVQKTPAVINPTLPTQLLLAVGETQEVDPGSKAILSAPYLQTFDIASNHNVSRQALTRTNVTNVNIAPNSHRISEARVTHIQISHDGAWLATVDEWFPPQRDLNFLTHSGLNIEDEQRKRREVYLKFWQWSKADQLWELVSRIDAPHTMAPEGYGAGKVLELTSDPSSSAFSTIGEDGAVRIWRPRTRTRDGVIVRGKTGEPLVNWTCQQVLHLGKLVMGEDAVSSDVSTSVRPEHGCIAFSEDGSILAAATSGNHDGLIHLIDPSTGSIRSSHPAMYRGDIVKIALLAQYLIVLADDLRVYDLVLDKLQYGVSLKDAKTLLSLEQKSEMMHLAVDRASRTFAIALPCRQKWKSAEGTLINSMSGLYSEISIFSPENASPMLTQSLPYLASALIPTSGSPGYVVLDTAAEITTLSPKTIQDITTTAKPMVDLRLDNITVDDEPAVELMQLIDEAEDDEKANGAIDNNEDESMGLEDDEEDDGPPVVSQQSLANVFDIGPAFALPPIEEMFYQVASLFSGKPVSQGA